MIRKGLKISVFLLLPACALSNINSGTKEISPADSPVYNTYSSEYKTNSPSCKIIVDHVLTSSPAAKGGLKRGDQILEINGEAISSLKKLLNILKRMPGGGKNRFSILRNGRKLKLILVAGKGNQRLGFRFIIRDKEIARQLKFKTWPDKINFNFKRFTLPFQELSLIAKNNRSPEMKTFHHLKTLLVSKGYIYTENYEEADFIVKAEFKYPDSVSNRPPPKKNLPFEAVRVLFLERKDRKPFLKISGKLDSQKAKIYGIKGYVYAILDSMIDKFPRYRDEKTLSKGYAAKKKRLMDDQPMSFKRRFSGTSPY